MTLNTRLYVLDPVDPMKLVEYFNKAHLKSENPSFTMGPSKWNEDKSIIQYSNSPGQGFAAWFDAEWREGGLPLFTEDVFDDDFGDPYLVSPACFMEISFDTGYAYRDELGGCALLHARWILDIYNYLQMHGARMQWKNEFTGEIHTGRDGLEDFLEEGDKAGDWFKSIFPVIIAEIAGAEKKSEL